MLELINARVLFRNMLRYFKTKKFRKHNIFQNFEEDHTTATASQQHPSQHTTTTTSVQYKFVLD